MAKDDTEKKEAADRTAHRVAEIANTFEWVITALALAFVFRAFVMEAFRIPTGSMADTLMGAHYRLRCTSCGYKYRYGESSYRQPKSSSQRRFLENSRCPSCGYSQAVEGSALSSGDRILVLKCIYQFYEPRQWDVVVFKNPLNPSENYIKRLVGRPGETVEIIDGDVYIKGKISRKPAKAQEELWMPVYDNDYQPARPEEPRYNGHSWRQPFIDRRQKWKVPEENPTIFRLSSSPEEVCTLKYDTTIGNDFRATYAYDEIDDYRFLPYCSDLMIHFWVNSDDRPSAGQVGAKLSKYGKTYVGRVDYSGQMIIERPGDGNEPKITTKKIETPASGKPVKFSFANVDHRLILEFGSERMIYDLGLEPNDAGERKTNIEPEAGIFGAGNLTVSHLALFRDIHYTSRNFSSNDPGRATEGNPVKLEPDQFFMLGDNSPRSADSRWWEAPGIGNDGKTYTRGIVPREYLVGKALFVYWPAGFKPYNRFPLAIIPNFGELRFIYGGSDYLE